MHAILSFPIIIIYLIDSSGTSGSDYSNTRRQAKKATAADSGSAETQEESVVYDDGPSQTRRSQSKGKKPAQASPAAGSDAEVEDDDEEDGDGDDEAIVEDWERVTGPFPEAAKIAARRLGHSVRIGAASIGRRYHKSIRQVMIHAGLSIQASRKQNIFNMYKMWYAREHPVKPGGMLH
jgi:hypothetical protein